MSRATVWAGLAWTAAVAVLAGSAGATTVYVCGIGDQGWMSDDTRSNSGVDLVGLTYTHAGKPGQVPTAADDAVIASQIQFVDGPAGSSGGAMKLSWVAGTGSGKATFSVIDTAAGFATGDWSQNFSATFRLYRETATNTTFKIGVQSTEWALSQAGFTALRSGEPSWDLVLVYAGAGTTGSWETIALTDTVGTWSLFDQAGNPYYTPPGNSQNKTLAAWAADATWGSRLFGAGAKVTNVQFGAGSFSVPSTGYVDWLQTPLLNGGDRVEFNVVPEPVTVAGLAMGLGVLARYVRRRTA